MASIRQHLERVATSLLTGKFRLLAPPEKPALAYGIAQLVDSLESLEHMLTSLSSAKQLAIDAEGINLCRTGKLCLLSVSPAPPPGAPLDAPAPVFLLDVTSLSSLAFLHKPGAAGGAGRARGDSCGGGGGVASPPPCLKDLLESSSVTKLFFDVRCDAEALFHQHDIKLNGVVDLQLTEVAYRRYGPAVRRVGYVIGLSKALEGYLAPAVRERWQATAVDKRALHDLFNKDPQYWDRRPLTQEQVRYAADDVLYLHDLHRELSAALTPPVLERVARFSEYRIAESQQPGITERVGAGDPTRAQAPPGL